MRLTKKSYIDKLTINQFKSYKKIATQRNNGIITYNELVKKLWAYYPNYNIEKLEGRFI